MKALIFSDTHGDINKVIDIINSHKNVDLIIHLGDLIRDAMDIKSIYTDRKIEYVSGNNDYLYNYIDEKVIQFGNKRILLTHGHKYKVKNTYQNLINSAKDKNVDIALFGHTHLHYSEVIDNILIMNPGSLCYPKNEPSYGMIEITNNKFNYMICKFDLK